MFRRYVFGSFMLTAMFLLLSDKPAMSQEVQVKPWFLVIVDTSRSMGPATPAYCGGTTMSNTCGFENNRMGAAKCVLQNIVNAYGDVAFGLMHFDFQASQCDTHGTCDSTANSGQMRVGILNSSGSLYDNQNDILALVDGIDQCWDQELVYTDSCMPSTPLGGSLLAARDYFEGDLAGEGFPTPTRIDVELTLGCRPVSVILLTDGVEYCGGQPALAAGQLWDGPGWSGTPGEGPGVAVPVDDGSGSTMTTQKKIPTYVIGFGLTPSSGNEVESIAQAGGTDAPGPYRAFYAGDETELSLAFSQIIADSQLIEVCNGEDDDCDGATDEGFPGLGDSCSAGEGACLATGTVICDPADVYRTICDATAGDPTPENSPATCQDGIDNDCDSLIDCDSPDDDCVSAELCNCVALPETCNGLDDDCDGLTDIDPTTGDPLVRQCGVDLGECDFGSQTCSSGSWGTCNATPLPGEVEETCNNLDDDCDGITDGIVQACTGESRGTCDPGQRLCTNGSWGDCSGAILPTVEICDGLDTDCDGVADETDADIAGVGDACDSSDDQDLCPSGEITCDDSSGEYRLYCAGDSNIEEICNGEDDNCDGAVDEGFGGDPCNQIWDDQLSDWVVVDLCSDIAGSDPEDSCGSCASGRTACIPLPSGGYGVACANVIAPSVEVCDGQDNDCDNLPDESDLDIPGTGGPCDGPDSDFCDNGTIICGDQELDGDYELYCSEDVSVTELCDAEDNDCDGANNEGLAVETEVCNQIWDSDSESYISVDLCPGTPAAGDICGECRLGDRTCVQLSNGSYDPAGCINVVLPSDEFCDGLDTDCDDRPDENEIEEDGNEVFIPGMGDACDGADGDFCKEGIVQCGQLEGEYQLICSDDTDTIVEVCNGIDDDCDFVIDEGNPDGGAQCSLQCDEMDQCVDVLAEVTCYDEGEPCGECRYGIMVCLDGGLQCQGAVGPGTEICDGLDNDCDGLTDEEDDIFDNDSTGLLGTTCGSDIGECETGIMVCLNGTISCDPERGSGEEERCDNKDNDCDGETDEDFNLGEHCGSDIGECYPGTYQCDFDSGEAICYGEVGAKEELCDRLDNDCDGETDEGLNLGEACGREEGLCEPGKLQCIDGDVLCVGEVPPGRERCDCADNDCDGLTDETDDGPLCPEGSFCIDCQCALLCDQSSEFIDVCPTGKAAKHFDEDSEQKCYCVEEICSHQECAQKVVKDTANEEVTLCAPDHDEVGTCVCKNNECTFPCNGVVCASGTICDKRDGRCKQQSCVVFGCEDDQVCDVITGDCQDDLCATANCQEDQACRDGRCYKSCNQVSCQLDEKCVEGTCEPDPCAGISCQNYQVCDPESSECVADRCTRIECLQGLVCNPLNGECEPDPCYSISCPKGEICQNTTCIEHCLDPAIECDGRCIDPRKDHEFCGASSDCEAENRGKSCVEEEVCADGICASECPEGKINCEGGCIDPMTDSKYCGAKNDCDKPDQGEVCEEDEVCVEGECIAVVQRSEDPEKVDHEMVLVTGGGGCSCTVPNSSTANPKPFAWLSILALIATIWLRRKRKKKGRASFPWSGFVQLFVICLLISGVLMVSGCRVEPFCLDCEETDNLEQSDASVAPKKTEKTNTGQVSVSDRDASAPDTGPIGCLDHEICNGKDDDCDGETDEDFDLNTDTKHCGNCQNSCERDHALVSCDEGECEMQGCDVGHHDLDLDEENGCEYRCLEEEEDDAICDLRDNDCDGLVDEDVDFANDPLNCGSCGFSCRFAHAVQGGLCIEGECVLNEDACDPGFHDIDGDQTNGCEYPCVKSEPDDEVCDNLDNDCDGLTDEEEDVADNDERIGDSCGTDEGECENGTKQCEDGEIRCVGEQKPQIEVCDGLDNNCDGDTDESDPSLDLPCKVGDGDYDPVGTCRFGHWECVDNDLRCVDGQGPVVEICDGRDNDCDNLFDEDGPGDGERCGESLLEEIMQQCQVEGNPCGVCRFGGYRCIGGQRICEDVVGPADFETCDNLDNDCDGETDEGLIRTCGINRGECTTGTETCTAGQWENCSAAQGILEVCDGKDNDCDGLYDENDSGDPLEQSCISACGDVGIEYCSWGTWQGCDAQQPSDEVCDGQDNDCDGYTDNIVNTQETIYQPCETLCGTGIESCESGSWGACSARQPEASETCDGIDNDCDGLTDNQSGTSAPITQSCNLGCVEGGTETCLSGVWQDCDAQQPQPEVCDGEDNDCNGTIDDNFNLEYDLNNCGTCNNLCPSIANGFVKCEPGSCGNPGCCQKAGCEPGYADDPDIDGPNYGGQDCEYECTYSGEEVCDGLDNDCDKLIDEDLTEPEVVCNPYGVCGDSSGGSVVPVICCGNGAGTLPAGCQTGDTGWTCAYSLLDDFGEEQCDDLDNDCDAATDEDFAELGSSCSSGVGICTGTGEILCDLENNLDGDSDTDTICGIDTDGDGQAESLVALNPSAAEVCDNMDNDCDGETDEPCSAPWDPTDPVSHPGVSDDSCVVDGWVELDSGVYIYAYEASRPNATDSDTGTIETRACSTQNVLPWTNIRYLDAQQACGDAGGRLCTEAEWQEACDISTCTWSYSSACTAYEADTCNGNDYDPIGGAPDDDEILPSGSMSGCYRTHNGSRVYDLSGNVKEWVEAISIGVNPLRGGAMNNTPYGISCGFSFTYANDDFLFFNTGFRCCHDAP